MKSDLFLKILSKTLFQGRTQGGLGFKPPLSLIFYKNFITWSKEI